MIAAIVISLISSAVMILATFALSKKLAGNSGGGTEAIESEINQALAKIEQLLKFAPGYVSKGQLSAVETQLTEENANLGKEKENLKVVEAKLETAQKLVEEKEGQQQETKSSREDDENKLRELMATYTDISGESMALERKLAASLKNLETIMSEVPMTDDQKAVLSELLNALTEGSSRLRELITEYQVVNDRVTMLNQQHGDLEEEYTKLVEQQLGE